MAYGRYRATVSNSDSMIDSSDVDARIDELESEVGENVRMIAAPGNDSSWGDVLRLVVTYGWTYSRVREAIEDSASWEAIGDPDDYESDDDAELSEEEAEAMRRDRADDDARDVTDEYQELRTLKAFAEEYGGGRHTTLISEDHFEAYCQNTAEECSGNGKDGLGHLANYIDWERYAEDCQSDYQSADFGGVTYYYQ